MFYNYRGNVAKNNKTRFFYVLYSDETWIFDQLECALGPICTIIQNNMSDQPQFQDIGLQVWFQAQSQAKIACRTSWLFGMLHHICHTSFGEGGRVPTFTQGPPEHTLQVMLVLQTKMCRHFQATGRNLVDWFTEGKKLTLLKGFPLLQKKNQRRKKLKFIFRW